ncbi:MAG: DUF2179 domain-containing protein [bacterium]|nr:DUF2179 domain-containing protein [bacterium]
MEHLLNSAIYTWFILPLLIFLARILDVSLGTIRLIFISKGMKYLAPIIGFFEILIWLLAIGQIMKNLNNIGCFIAYGGGFALGTFLGIFIEEKLSLGMVTLRIITQKDASELIQFLQSKNYGITCIDAKGAQGQVKIIFMIIRRQDLKNVIAIINRFNPNAFYSVEDIRFVSEGIFPLKKSGYGGIYLRLFRGIRKGK